MMVVPPESRAIEAGPRFGKRGLVAGALLGAMAGALIFWFFDSYWGFLVVPISGGVGYFTRSIVNGGVLPPDNVMW